MLFLHVIQFLSSPHSTPLGNSSNYLQASFLNQWREIFFEAERNFAPQGYMIAFFPPVSQKDGDDWQTPPSPKDQRQEIRSYGFTTTVVFEV